MKTFTKSIFSRFSFPPLARYASKLTVVSVVIINSPFSTAYAQDAHPGEVTFKMKCAMCHGQKGEGIAVFPPLAESEWVNGPEENLVRIQLRGLMGPIKVKGKDYNAMMPANVAMSDEEIANVLSYVRSSMGNKAPAITVDTVKAIRAKEAGKTAPLTVKDLIDPTKPKDNFITEATELEGFKPAEGNGSSSVILLALGIIGVCTLPAVAGLVKN